MANNKNTKPCEFLKSTIINGGPFEDETGESIIRDIDIADFKIFIKH